MDLRGGGTSIWYMDSTGLGPLCHLLSFVHISDTQLSVKDLWIGGHWDFFVLYTLILEDIPTHIRSIPIPSISVDELDTWTWKESYDCNYTTKS
ncbi:putative ribonuclease H protein, partial [Sesbania bispinosa]